MTLWGQRKKRSSVYRDMQCQPCSPALFILGECPMQARDASENQAQLDFMFFSLAFLMEKREFQGCILCTL